MICIYRIVLFHLLSHVLVLRRQTRTTASEGYGLLLTVCSEYYKIHGRTQVPVSGYKPLQHDLAT